MDANGWMLTLTAIAALGGITGVWVLVLHLLDRPIVRWNVAIKRQTSQYLRDPEDVPRDRPLTVTDPHRVWVTVSVGGNAPAYEVEIRHHGCKPFGDKVLVTQFVQLTPGSEPLTYEFRLPPMPASTAWFEIHWTRLRPRRRRGYRVDLRKSDDQPGEEYKRFWSSLWLKRDWRERKVRREASIPEPSTK